MCASCKRTEERDYERSSFSAYNIHPCSNKMYHNLKDTYWWIGVKRDISNFVSKCLTCQQVKLEHQRKSLSFNRQKSYADPKRKDMSFSAEDLEILKSISCEESDEMW